MTIKETLEEYLEGKRTAVSVIRVLSGAFNPDAGVSLLALICAITQVEEGDLEKDLFRQLWLVEPSDNA